MLLFFCFYIMLKTPYSATVTLWDLHLVCLFVHKYWLGYMLMTINKKKKCLEPIWLKQKISFKYKIKTANDKTVSCNVLPVQLLSVNLH